MKTSRKKLLLVGLLCVPVTNKAILSGWDIVGLYFVLKFAMYMYDSQHGCACCKVKGKNHTCKIRVLNQQLEQLRLEQELRESTLKNKEEYQQRVVYVE